MAFWIANADLEVRNQYCIGIKDVAQIKIMCRYLLSTVLAASVFFAEEGDGIAGLAGFLSSSEWW